MADEKIIIEFGLPIKGFSEGFPVENQPANTSGSMNNVRPIFEGRIRLAQRPPLDKAYSQQIGTTNIPIVYITSVTVVD